MADMLSKIKSEIKRSSGNLNDVFYLGEDESAKLRFLEEVDDALEVRWHDKYDDNIDTPCLKYYDLECPHCKSSDEELRTRNLYCWSVYNQEDDIKQIFKFPANRFSPVPQLIEMYEAYGTLTERDYLIKRTGSGFDTNYNVVPMDKEELDKDIEPHTKEEIMEVFKQIHNIELEADLDDDEELPF